jgi:hypothetical protein
MTNGMLVPYITNMRTLNDPSNCYLNYLKCVEWTSILTEMFKAIYKYVKVSTMISARNDVSIFPLSYLTWRVLLFVQDESCYLYMTGFVICTGRVLLFVHDGSCYLYRTGLVICTRRVLLFVHDGSCYLYRTRKADPHTLSTIVLIF